MSDDFDASHKTPTQIKIDRDYLRHVLARIAASPEKSHDAEWLLGEFRRMAIDALEHTK